MPRVWTPAFDRPSCSIGHLKRAILAVLLGVMTAAAFAWGVPALALFAGWVKPAVAYGPSGAGAGRNVWWGDDAGGHARGGVYTIDRRFVYDSVDMRRIIFAGMLAEQEFYRQNPPPAWAAVISLDMREGFEEVLTVAQGWPWRCVRGELWIDWSPAAPQQSFTLQANPGGGFSLVTPPAPPPYRVTGAKLVKRSNGDEFLLPTIVDWPRAAANIGVLGGAFFVILIVPYHARRLVRRMRRRCAGCGYDLKGLTDNRPCPECGRRRGIVEKER